MTDSRQPTEYTKCPKCEHRFDWYHGCYVKWTKDRSSYIEALRYECAVCGFFWSEKPADAR